MLTMTRSVCYVSLFLKYIIHNLNADYNCVSRFHYLGRCVTKPVFGVSDKARFKPVSSATEVSQKIEISLVASLDMILSNRLIT